MRTNDYGFYQAGRIFLGIFFLMKALQCFLFTPDFWNFVAGIIYGAASIGFLLNYMTRLSAVMVSIVMVLIIIFKAVPGLSDEHSRTMAILTIATNLAVIGGALMVGSFGSWINSISREEMFYSKRFYVGGRVLTAIFFLTVGYLHFANSHQDASMMGNFPGALFWVLFIGVCWFATAVSFWLNIMARTASLLASVVIILICVMITSKGFSAGKMFDTYLALSQNFAIIGSCLLVGYKGYYGFRPSEMAH